MSFKTRLAALGILGLPVLILWLFGGIIGAIISVANHDALSAVLSLLIPIYGTIVTIVAIFRGIF
jgi:hypothetical protein